LDPKAKGLYDQLRALQATCPPPDAPGFLDHYDLERRTFRALVAVGEARLETSRAEELRQDLHARLADAKLQEGTLAWQRAWDHHWSRIVGGIWGFTSESPSCFTPSPKPAVESDEDEQVPCETENLMEEPSPSMEASKPVTPEEGCPFFGEGIQVEGDAPEGDPVQGAEVLAIDPVPAPWDAWSPEAVLRGSEVYDQILGQIEQTPKSVAARILRQVSPGVIAYQPGTKLLLACSVTENVRGYQRYLQTAREVAESIGLPGLVIEFRHAQQAA
jgi:hypothetical protein